MDIDVWTSRHLQHESQGMELVSENPIPVNEVNVAAMETQTVTPPTGKSELPDPTQDQSVVGIEEPAESGVKWSTLAEIGTAVLSCNRCRLSENRTNGVPGEGHGQADWMFIGEGPGQNEDLQGRPFVGRAGQLLDAMIKALGMNREDVFIANVVKCRPPGNRDPKPDEVSACIGYLNAQIDLIKPRVIVVLGRIAAQALLQSTEPLARLRGKTHYFSDQQIPMVVTYHPAYLLRSPEQKAKAWDDLWKAKTLTLAS